LGSEAVDFGPVTTPTLLIWGKNDPYIRRMSVDMAGGYMLGPYRVVEADAGHWLVQGTPELVYRAMLEHLKANAI
jgi:pimeloyl-ACP methyl ester carboxylesterase